MHKYVYVDWDRNYVFNVGSSGNWEELVSFNYINGVTSSGATGSNQGSSALGAFTVPASTHFIRSYYGFIINLYSHTFL